MRCKNCGSENEDNLYICQNCGSPLYDEDDNDALAEDEMGKTKVVPAVAGSSRGTAQPAHTSRTNTENDEKQKQKQKEKTIAVIVILAVVLAVVVGVLAAVLISNSKSKNDVEDTSVPIVTTTEAPSTTAPTTTTQTTTETTTESTTESTTVVEYNVTVSCSQGGEVEGDGVYAKGEKCTVIARADDGFVFDGWYKNGKRVSSNEVYSFSVKSNTDLEAVFTDYSDVTDYVDEE